MRNALSCRTRTLPPPGRKDVDKINKTKTHKKKWERNKRKSESQVQRRVAAQEGAPVSRLLRCATARRLGRTRRRRSAGLILAGAAEAVIS